MHHVALVRGPTYHLPRTLLLPCDFLRASGAISCWSDALEWELKGGGLGREQVPSDCARDKKFDLNMFTGRWYITAGLNPLFDTFPCQEHYFGVPEPGTRVRPRTPAPAAVPAGMQTSACVPHLASMPCRRCGRLLLFNVRFRLSHSSHTFSCIQLWLRSCTVA